jgi:hypothetical protein
MPRARTKNYGGSLATAPWERIIEAISSIIVVGSGRYPEQSECIHNHVYAASAETDPAKLFPMHESKNEHINL